MSRESEFPKRLAAEEGVPALIDEYFSQPENKRKIGELHSKILDLIWEAIEEQKKQTISWARNTAANLGNLYFGHFCTQAYGIPGHGKQITYCYFQHGQHRGTHFFMEKVLLPEALKANKKAIGILVLLTNLSDNDTGKLAKSHLLNVFQLQPQLGRSIIEELEKRVDKNPHLLYLAGQIDPVWTYGVCEKWMDIPGKDSNERNLHGVVVAAGLQLDCDQLALFINRLESFWSSVEWREDWDVRSAFYVAVHRGFTNGILDEKTALNYLSGLFDYGFTCDLCGKANAFEVLQEVAKDGYVDVLYHGFLVAASGKKGQKRIRCGTGDKQIKSFLEGLEEPLRRSFLMGAVLGSVDHEFLWLALKELAKFPTDEEIRQTFKKALETKNGDKLFYLGQFYLKIRHDRNFKDIREKWIGLGDFVPERLKKEKDPDLIYKIAQPIVYWGSEDNVAFMLPFLEKALLETKKLFKNLVMLALAAHFRLNGRKETKKDQKREMPKNNAIMELLERVHRVRSEELLKVIYLVIREDTRDMLILECLAFPAIAFISHLKLPASVSRVSDIVMRQRTGNDMSIDVNTACAGFLRMMALDGNMEAMKTLAKIPENPTCIWPAPTAILAQISKDAVREDVKMMAIELASQRMFNVLTGKVHSYVHIEVESIASIHAEPLVQKRFLDGLETGLKKEVPDGIGNAITKIPELVIPENRPRAVAILKDSLLSVGCVAGGTDFRRKDRIRDLDNLVIFIFEALHKLEMMKD